MKCLFLIFVAAAYISTTYAAPVSSEIQQDDDPLNEDALLKQILIDVARSQQDNDGNNSPAEAQFLGALAGLVAKPLLGALGSNVIGAVGSRIFGRRRRRRPKYRYPPHPPYYHPYYRPRYEAAELQEDPLTQALLENQLEGIAKEQQDGGDGDNGDLIATIERLLEVAAQDDGDADNDEALLKLAEMQDLMGNAVEQDDGNLMAAIEKLPEEARAQFFWSLLPAGLSLASSFFHRE